MAALVEALDAAEVQLRGLGMEPNRLVGAVGFARIEALRDAVEALYGSDEAKRRFEIIARQVFVRFKAVLMEPSVRAFAEQHDNIEAIYKKLSERRDTADVTDALKHLHRIVNATIRGQEAGDDHAEGLTVDLSRIDFQKPRDKFAAKATAIKDLRELIEAELQAMLARNPLRMDFQRKYQEIVADYNREKNRVTVEATFAALIDLVRSRDAEERRAVWGG